MSLLEKIPTENSSNYGMFICGNRIKIEIKWHASFLLLSLSFPGAWKEVRPLPWFRLQRNFYVITNSDSFPCNSEKNTGKSFRVGPWGYWTWTEAWNFVWFSGDTCGSFIHRIASFPVCSLTCQLQRVPCTVSHKPLTMALKSGRSVPGRQLAPCSSYFSRETIFNFFLGKDSQEDEYSRTAVI